MEMIQEADLAPINLILDDFLNKLTG